MTRCILVVEDDIDIRETVGELLESEGYEVVLAENGADALNQLARMALLPALIFLDLMMPVKDGFAFRAEQRATPRLAHIPVVVMSADPGLDTHDDLLAARSYIRKPFEIGLILAAAAA